MIGGIFDSEHDTVAEPGSGPVQVHVQVEMLLLLLPLTPPEAQI